MATGTVWNALRIAALRSWISRACSSVSTPVYIAPASRALTISRSGRTSAVPSASHWSTVASMIRCIRGTYAVIASLVRMPCSMTSLRLRCSGPSSRASERRKICSTEIGSLLPRSMAGSVANRWNASAPESTTKLMPNRRVLKIGPYLSNRSV